MAKLCLLVFLFAAASAAKITLNVFSGVSDPTWTLSARQVVRMKGLLAAHQMDTRLRHIMGYTGFTVDGATIRGSPIVEQYLLSTAPAKLLSAAVIEHVRTRIGESVVGRPVFDDLRVEKNNSGSCDHVVGPDTVPQYNPSSDDGGCFEIECSNNNCYNYANDIVTNTFAQPGRGTGHKWVTDNCSSVTAGAKSDGLVWAGTTLPTTAPPSGHYVAMLIWPQTNFHWIRMDASKYWSHKPGSTPVRDVDDDGQRITDPSKADFAPWTQFCGYFVSVPSRVTIN